jgi:alpha-galactosidase
MLAALTACRAGGVTVTQDEMAQARRWASARFQGRAIEPPTPAGLTVVANNDAVQRNQRAGKPLNIAGVSYTRGLYCHAVSKVVVRLPGKGERFTAVAGVDSNDQTSGGRGSIVFSVSTGGAERYRSGVMREGQAGRPVSVALQGATELTLEVSDAGDGISCDQADWADARVTLAGGKTVWLGDLPILTAPDEVSTEPPFSFSYGGRPSSDLLRTWKLERAARTIDRNRAGCTLTWTDPATKLQVRCEAVEYRDFPTVEWTVYLKNTGAADTPIIEDWQALDIRVTRGADGEFTLHHNVGSPASAVDYRPLQDTLGPGATMRITTNGGRPTNSDLPYFNIEQPGGGVIAVLGWPGQWAARFTRDSGNGLRIVGGQETTHFRLHPGEEVRSPLVVLQFWKGDALHAQNVWRQWMLAHNTPRPGGRLPATILSAGSSHQFGEMIHANEANQKLFVDRYLEEGIKLDYWWMDAGWYVYDPGYSPAGWPDTGTWEVDTKRFPNGLRAVTDHAHSKGVRSIVWFEPERVAPGTWLYTHHPEWLLGQDGREKLLNLGNPAARAWITDHIDGLLTSQGIDLYRQDFNIDPLPMWRANDAEDRQGITENHYVTGYLAYWDELRRRHPDMLIDTCASGGRRNDIETLRRAVPLLRSDYIFEPTGQQNHTYGIASWIPLYGTGVDRLDAYGFRSIACPFLNVNYDVRDRAVDWAAVRRLVGEWRRIAPYFTGDYYPLTPYSPENDAWMGWQFDRPDLGEGTVEAFRRPDSIYEAARLKLHGLDPGKRYRVTNRDTGQSEEISGSDLAAVGLLITLPQQPDSAVLVYKRL